MARRYGGAYSPGGDPRSDEERSSTAVSTGPKRGKKAKRKRVNPVGARVNILFMLPFLWAFSAFFRDPAGLAQHLGVFALLMLSAWLTREGVIAQDAYAQRRVARRPAIPRKIFGSVVMGLGLGLAGLGSAYGMAGPVIFGLFGAGLHFFAFGPDPLRDKGMEGIDEFQTDRVARAIDTAEAYLAAMSDAMLRARDRTLESRLTDFQSHVRELLRTVEDDPQNLTAARRYLSVYLEGARDATVKFVEIYERDRNAEARSDYVALLDDLEQNFMLRTETLRDNDRQALDIEIDVLRERLEREGLRPRIPGPNSIPDPQPR
ncbi:5-bromo-4-chloroindolyl phosphate hydrolysis family protein [Pararhodobacter zhoushanensis]|uniref:5-bromo-4-chloroindolyl phosphate hydrolysis family protein n=1 Tax=Pararhodobacter zhoushanensis TaxID=2479545 RepID=A0ABT3GYC6_9RHOB|nr:5-bromo-4-chloroindolyl phosphate hydrolysis family protein [Pararhodobacter zhoushanensis]MCW1932564.1 5-bromo-4-chloroindolyl phosphate hydrolysis family protein [Pararhodobacter zhoushanensis]